MNKETFRTVSNHSIDIGQLQIIKSISLSDSVDFIKFGDLKAPASSIHFEFEGDKLQIDFVADDIPGIGSMCVGTMELEKKEFSSLKMTLLMSEEAEDPTEYVELVLARKLSEPQ